MSDKRLCACGRPKKWDSERCFACFQIYRTGRPRKRQPIAERFWVKVEKTDDCWLWTGATNGRGYGRFGVAVAPGKWGFVGEHRFAYELLIGPIPDGLVLDHLCGVERCVNPAHLEPVTQAENIRRSSLGRDGLGRFKRAA